MRHSLDRLSSALVSDDLTVRGGRCDVDYVAALGYASITYPMASPLIRLYLSHDRAAVKDARRAAFAMARKAAIRRGMAVRSSELAQIGEAALAYVVNKCCPRCHGTKYELIPGTTSLGTHHCKACDGDGRRRLPVKYRRLIVEVVAAIERIESTIDVIVGSRM